MSKRDELEKLLKEEEKSLKDAVIVLESDEALDIRVVFKDKKSSSFSIIKVNLNIERPLGEVNERIGRLLGDHIKSSIIDYIVDISKIAVFEPLGFIDVDEEKLRKIEDEIRKAIGERGK